MKALALWRWRLGLGLAGLDSLWAWVALSTERQAHAVSNVEMLQPILWIFIHLPAVALGSLFVKLPPAPEAAMPPAALWIFGFLGTLQAAALGLLLGWWMDKRKAQRPS